jgi:drug/metabolite transporter (DMT)-like permease
MVAALLSASAINFGLVLQKQAVARGGSGALLRRLRHDPLWLGGFALQTLIGAPLNVAAVALAGPASVPGIMALGLVVLAAASAFYAKEKLGPRELGGIGIIMAGVLCVAGARLGVDLLGRSPSEEGLPLRMLILAGLITLSAIVAERWAALQERSTTRGSPALLAASSGSWTALTNLSLGILSQSIASVLGSGAPAADWIILALAFLAVAYSSVVAVILTQRAFLAGKATIVVPVQQAPIQLFAPLSFLVVYRPRVPSLLELALALLGAALAVGGAILLSRGSHRKEDAGRASRRHA